MSDLATVRNEFWLLAALTLQFSPPIWNGSFWLESCPSLYPTKNGKKKIKKGKTKHMNQVDL